MEYQRLTDSSQVSYGATTSVPSPSTNESSSSTLILCSHGNKYGFAECCNDFTANRESGSEIIPPPVIPLSGSMDNLEHCHTERESGIDLKAKSKLMNATRLCMVFLVVEIVGYAITGSLLIATDAAHLLSDLASFMISLFAVWLAARPSTRNMSFGWHRAEIIGALISVLLIWVLTGVFVFMAIHRIVNNDYEVKYPITMLITSGIGIGVNIIMGCSLHQHGHTHGSSNSAVVESGTAHNGGHGHAHDADEKEEDNINVKAAFIHVVGDFVQSIGVFIAAIIINCNPNRIEFHIVDPICTLLFSVLVLATTFTILRNTVNVLMERVPKHVDFSVVKNTILQVPGIVSVHNLRIWALTTNKTALTAHLAIDASRSAQEILKEASRMIRTKYDVYEMTLQVENYQPDMNTCTQCQDSGE